MESEKLLSGKNSFSSSTRTLETKPKFFQNKFIEIIID